MELDALSRSGSCGSSSDGGSPSPTASPRAIRGIRSAGSLCRVVASSPGTMELAEFNFYGRVFDVKIDSEEGCVRLNCAIPAGVAPKLDRVFGNRFLWYDLYRGGSAGAVAGNCRYTVTRTG
ncbi:hypothetical protein PLESTB_001487900 [Pleodorina starrii]|uniref:Uncharacterized protein n=1 Tax=Pleodorina starrii TaxID=330485 RepID=A0A9W6F7R5_9CHLO|nr:hypothetical protein PLESTM_001922600 [Pleodorina starrii]GLC59444.1 hypothetical protein PLESTB_001487900 [Pleodorina starrii]